MFSGQIGKKLKSQDEEKKKIIVVIIITKRRKKSTRFRLGWAKDL
jgi:hypothetical protein